MNWLRNWWWSRQRKMDLLILWPECKRLAPDMDRAKAAFMVHASIDPAWVCYYRDDLWKAVDELK